MSLNEVTLQVSGRAELPLPAGVDASQVMVLLRRPDATGVIELAPDAFARLDRARVTARLAESVLVMKTEPE